MAKGEKIKKAFAWVKEKTPDVLDFVGDVLPDKGGLGVIKNIINRSDKLTQQQKEEFNKLHEQAIEEFELEIKDRSDARAMQIAALQQDDKLSKWFVHLLAGFSVIGGFALITMLFWVDIPDKNRDMVYMAVGFILGTILNSVYGFYYGSSMSSKKRSEDLVTLLKQK